MPRDSELEQQFIARLAQAAIAGTLPAKFSEDNAIEVMTGFVGPAAVAALLTELYMQNLIRQTRTDPVEFEITMKLLRKAEEIGTTSGANTVIEAEADAKSSELGRGATSRRYPTVDDVPDFDSLADFDELTEVQRVSDIGVPASDRIVPLDHNSPDYQETLKALSELSEEARKSNEFSALFADPEDRIVVLSQIDTGIQLLKNERVIPNVVKKVLQYPIHFIKENMPGAALGALASKAWDWVVKLLENLV